MSPAARDARADQLRGGGGPHLMIEPRRGYVSWRARNVDTGEVIACAALKELLHRIADDLTRLRSPRVRD